MRVGTGQTGEGPIGSTAWRCPTWRLEPSLGSILKEQIDGATAAHSFQHNFGRAMDDEQRARFAEQYPHAHHPVVRRHPETGKKGIYVDAAFTTHIEGIEPAESRRLLRFLYRQASIPEYQYRFRWQENSVAFWDNRAVQHYAAFDYFPNQRRVERVTVVGDKPF